MPRIRNPSKTSWRPSIGHISYPTLPNEPDAFDVGAPTENTEEENPAVRELLNRHAERLREMRTHVENIQAIHDDEFNITVREANARINELTASLSDKDELIAFRDEKIQRLERELASRPHTSVESEGEGKPPEWNNRTESSDRLETRKIKTIVLSDPDEFTGKNEPRIDDWALKIQSKLKRNAHLFPTEDLKIGYVQNLLGGQALRRLEPRFREGSKNPYSTASDIVADLRRMYGDPNRELAASNAFRDLRMKSNFTDFWAEFQRLSGELDHSERHLLKEFIHKLTPELQRQLAVDFRRATDLYETASLVREVTERWKTADTIENENQKRKSNAAVVKNAIVTPSLGANKPLGTTRTGTTSAPASTANTTRLLTRAPSRVPRTPHPDPVKEKSMVEGRCFNCNEYGHISRECPKPKVLKVNEVTELSDDEDSGKEESLPKSR